MELSDEAKERADLASVLVAEAQALAEDIDLASQNIKNLATTSDDVAAGLTAASSATVEMRSAVVEISGQAHKAAEMARFANQDATETERVFSALGDRAEQINDAVRIIEQIASQTKMLALNATIEAARAGDMGRGFGVVAGEVKTLSSRTEEATNAIAALVGAINQSV